MASPLAHETLVALEAVRAACRVARAVQASPSQCRLKVDLSPVTIADYACQAVLAYYLSREFPQDPVIGEEDAADLRRDPELTAAITKTLATNYPPLEFITPNKCIEYVDHAGHQALTKNGKKRYWTVDPIDGTKGFIRGAQYAVCLALIENGTVQIGVLGCPNLEAKDNKTGVLVYAIRGQGTHELPLLDAEESPLVSASSPLRLTVRADEITPRLLESYETTHSDRVYSETLVAALGGGQNNNVLRIDSQCKYAVLARGEGQVYLRLLPNKTTYREKIWDHASGSLIVSEAGGIITDVQGNPLDFSTGSHELIKNRGILASSGPPEFHKRLLCILNQIDNASASSDIPTNSAS